MTKGNLHMRIALLTLGLIAPVLAFAGEPASDVITSPRVTVVDGSLSEAPALGTGMIVAIDPDTGALRAPTTAEAADLTTAARFQAKHPEGADLQQFEIRSGGTGLLLDSRYLISEQVDLRLDGSLSASHQMGAVDWLSVLQPATAEEEPTAETAANGETGDTGDTGNEEVQP